MNVVPPHAVVPAWGSVPCRVTLIPYCVGHRVASIPIVAPTAAPAGLGEQLSLRVGFVGAAGAARIEVLIIVLRRR